MSRKDAKFREELLTSLFESLSSESSSSKSTYANSFRIIEHLVTLTEASQLYEQRLLRIFDETITGLGANHSRGVDYLTALFECLNLVVAKSSNESESMTLQFDMIERLVDYCVLPPAQNAIPIYTNETLVVKLSLLIKSFVLKSVRLDSQKPKRKN